MIARAAIYVAAALLGIVLLALGVALWLLHTQPGSARVWTTLASVIPGELQAGSVEGSIAGGWHLRHVTYRNESLEVTIADARLTLDFDLFAPSLDVVGLEAQTVVVHQVGQTESRPSDGEFSLESLVLPVAVNLQSLQVRDLQVRGREGERLFDAGSIALAGRWHESIVLTRADIESSLADVRGAAELGLQVPHAADASLEVRYPLAIGEEVVPLAVAVDAEGSLERLRIDLVSRDPDIHIAGELFEVLRQPGWDLRVQSGYFQWPLQGAAPAVRLEAVILESRGRPEDYSLAGSGRITAVADQPLGFSLEAGGDREGLSVSGLSLDGEMLRAESDGALRWANGFAVMVNADIAHFDPAALTDAWPAGTPVSGTARAAFSPGKLELPAVALRVAGTDQAVDADGIVDLAAGVVDLDLDWRNLRWPVADTWRFRSDFGQVTVTGKPESWALDGRIAFATPELPQGAFQLAGTGNRDETTVQLLDSEVLGGNVKGRVEYNWGDGGRWAAALEAADIDTGALALQWPGRVSAAFTTRGQVEPLRAAVDITQLAGTLRERPVSGSGGIRYADGDLSVEQLEIASGNSWLRADGSLRADAGLDFSLDIASLGALLPGSAGSLQARGNIGLKEDFPVLRLDLDGRELAWRDYRLGSIAVAKPAAATAPLALAVDGEALQAAGASIDEFSLDVTAGPDRQRLAARAVLGDKRVEIALAGRFEDWREPLASGWDGRLESLRLAAPEDVAFALEAPARLHLGSQLVELDRACLRGAGEAAVCLQGRRDGPEAFSASAELRALPVNLVKLFLDTELIFTETVGGTLSAAKVPGRELSATARLDISPGQVRSPERAALAVSTRQGVFSLDLDDGQVLSARLNLPFSETAAIDANFGLVDVSRGRDSAISGNLKVDLNDIGVITAVVPALDQARGKLAVDIALAGTLAEPALSGGASLENGALRYVPLGLKLTDIELTSRIRGDNYVDLQSTFRAGEGAGRIYSSTGGLGAEGVRLRITGENLAIVDLPQVNVVANTDLELGISPGELRLDGDILVPHARLSPRQIVTGQVSESRDVVIVASREGEPLPEAAEAPPPFAINGEVELTLGDDVLVDFDAAQTRLTGMATFAWRGPPMPIATGEYKVSGRFEAYGQLLEITEGSVRFPNVPADNPLLRIRAERQIFGNPRIQSAGVLLSGVARDPELEVYTVPPTSNERALTMLVTGSDFNYEQGVGAVDVGTYIAPDVYLSYGIGLFERDNVVSLRYDIARGFGIKVTSGKRAEGVDLSYTFER